MKLWLLLRINDDKLGYDEYYAHIIRAETEESARKLAPVGDEGVEVWLNSAYSTCEVLEAEGPEGEILSEYREG